MDYIKLVAAVFFGGFLLLLVGDLAGLYQLPLALHQAAQTFCAGSVLLYCVTRAARAGQNLLAAAIVAGSVALWWWGLPYVETMSFHDILGSFGSAGQAGGVMASGHTPSAP